MYIVRRAKIIHVCVDLHSSPLRRAEFIHVCVDLHSSPLRHVEFIHVCVDLHSSPLRHVEFIHVCVDLHSSPLRHVESPSSLSCHVVALSYLPYCAESRNYCVVPSCSLLARVIQAVTF